MEYKDDKNKIRLRVDLLKKKRFFWYWLREYSSVIVAAGTLVLAGVTGFHIHYTSKLSVDTKALAKATSEMSTETKKLAESTEEMSMQTKRLAEFTKEMSEETKRLVNLGIQEFKMRAYPDFLIETKGQKVNLTKDGKLHQSLKIVNKGEITAHHCTFLIVN